MRTAESSWDRQPCTSSDGVRKAGWSSEGWARHCFPGLTVDDNIAVVHRYRNLGEPIWAESTVVDPAGLAKAQEIMVIGGVLPADKKVAYDKIVTNAFAEKAKQKYASK